MPDPCIDFCSEGNAKLYCKVRTLTFEREEKLQQKETADYHFDFYGPTQPETSQQAILEELEDQHKFRTEQLKIRYQRLIFLFSTINVGIVDLLFPVALGLLVFFDPYFVDSKISDQPIEFVVDTNLFDQTVKTYRELGLPVAN